MSELWKIIEGYPNYSVSSYGRVRNNKRLDYKSGGILANRLNMYGYVEVCLYHNEAYVFRRVHRLVAKAFVLGESAEHNQVNHLDGDKTNNRASNLEWCTPLENTQHSAVTGLRTTSTVVSVTDHGANAGGNTDRTGVYPSISELARTIGIKHDTIIPYIKYSNEYPFMGRYTITIDDYNLSNSNSLGKKIYVYDLLSSAPSNCTIYKGANAAAFSTGIKSLSDLNKFGCVNIAGYVIAKDQIADLSKYTAGTMADRMKYMAVPYRGVKYALYDYTRKEESRFDNLKDMTIKVAALIPDKNITTANLGAMIARHKVAGRTGLCYGYGVTSISVSCDTINWHEYSDRELYNSRMNLPINSPVYVLNDNGNTYEYPGSLIKMVGALADRLPISTQKLTKYDISLDKINALLPDGVCIKSM